MRLCMNVCVLTFVFYVEWLCLADNCLFIRPLLQVYSDKLTELKTEGEPIKQRRLEFELRPGALDDFALAIQLANKAVDLYK